MRKAQVSPEHEHTTSLRNVGHYRRYSSSDTASHSTRWGPVWFSTEILMLGNKFNNRLQHYIMRVETGGSYRALDCGTYQKVQYISLAISDIRRVSFKGVT